MLTTTNKTTAKFLAFHCKNQAPSRRFMYSKNGQTVAEFRHGKVEVMAVRMPSGDWTQSQVAKLFADTEYIEVSRRHGLRRRYAAAVLKTQRADLRVLDCASIENGDYWERCRMAEADLRTALAIQPLSHDA